MSNENALKELDRALGYIMSKELKDEDKGRIVADAIENYNTYINPGWLKYRKSISTNAAFVEWMDDDSYFYDVYGEKFIDCLGGFGIYMCGHRNPEILKAVEAQLHRQALHSQELLDPLRGYLAKAVAEITPGDLQYCFFTNGGAEAVEMALKLARIATGGRWYISTVGGFHGKSMGALSMGGKDTYRIPYLPIVQQVQHVEYGVAADVRKAIKNLTTVGEKVAAVILEPIQGEAGIIIPPKGYLKEVREICDEYGVCLIFDEIQTGMGRTGTMFRCEAEGVIPDILTYGKAFGGGIMPITGIIARPHLWTEELQDNPWILGSPTFGGNPLACSAAIATIDFMLRHDIPRQAKEKGDYLIGKLRAVQVKYPRVLSDIRGLGLMIGVEFPKSEIGYIVAKGMFARRVMTAGTLNNSKVIRFEPAATTSYEDFDIVAERFEQAVAEADAQIDSL
ncbi:Putrescine aminotransferase [Candidatus Desulfosporosinus infrequens]|uniref:Putrescine aminotransferase n=1 Tax=Candidatus Desulfosporosinus infrequens TaxID=2043169 RepID=A0A2U3KE63_9FIRM|nr:Putrescine aminotransferase [Candidatus Desulfosporosinus infrequens]